MTDTPLLSRAIIGGVLVVRLDHPPVNALSAALRQALQTSVRDAAADPAVRAIVIAGVGRGFSGGADIREFGKAPLEPSLSALIATIEDCSKPVVAAIHGMALGGGLELALGCHARLATADAQLGLPEVKLGLLPGAGGTQRLPRLVGPDIAVEMITSGSPVSGRAAERSGLIDLIERAETLEAAAVAHAKSLAGQAPFRVRDRLDKITPVEAHSGIFAAARERVAHRFRGYEAPRACVEAVEAAVTGGFEEGLALERRLFEQLVASRQSAALRHVFFAERQAARVPDLAADTPVLPITHVGIVGAGTMGTGIAMAFANAGLTVTVTDPSAEALDRCRATLQQTYASAATKGRITAEEAVARQARITTHPDLAALSAADLIVEAVFEEMDVKRKVVAALDTLAHSDALIASNTSYLDIDAIAGATSRPERLLGLHFFSPAHLMRLVEIVRGAKTAPAALATALGLAKRLGKIPVVVGNAHGFVGNRMLAVRQREANKLVLEGALPQEVDRVLVAFGLPMGPFAMADLAGLDLGWTRATSTGATLRERLCELDRRGQKTGRGFYDYDSARRATPSAEVEALIRAFAAERGLAQRSIGETEILERCLYPMINEGARLLAEGVAARASDIDIVWINGYRWPPYRGGPMFYADTIGLPHICERLRAYEAESGDDYAVAPLLADYAARGRGFAEA